MFFKSSLGLVLGGGAAKGLAHLGVFQALEDMNISPHIITGTSIGALVGALYALNPNSKMLIGQARKIVDSEELRSVGLDIFYDEETSILKKVHHSLREIFALGSSLIKQSIVEEKTANNLFHRIFGEQEFRDLHIRFAAAAVDLYSGREVIFKSGLLRDAVAASCAIPGLFPPVKREEMLLVDGGVLSNVPVRVARSLGADVIMGISLGEMSSVFNLDKGFRIFLRSEELARKKLTEFELMEADLVIKPEAQIHWANFSKLDYCIKKGREAVLKNIPEVKKILSKRYWVKKKFSR